MKVSKKAYYGLRAIIALAHTKKPLSIHEIAVLEALPEDYLEKILQILRREGMVSAKKGTAGGYTLAQPIDKITTWDIIRILDGPIKMYSPKTGNALPCEQVSHCQTNLVIRSLETAIEKTLSHMTIKQLTQQPRR